jgi:hypothetical protein
MAGFLQRYLTFASEASRPCKRFFHATASTARRMALLCESLCCFARLDSIWAASWDYSYVTQLAKHTALRVCLCLAAIVLPSMGQTARPAPVFTREGIGAVGRSANVLAPGLVMTLYGGYLAPGDNVAPESAGCGKPKVQPALELCGVRVLIDTTPAELLYVSAGQINFKVPPGMPEDGFAPLRVCVEAICSAPVRMWFSTRTALLSLERPAYVHMAVWIHVDPPPPHSVSYPCWNGLSIPPEYEFEVRQGGNLVPARPQPSRPLNFGSGDQCAALGGRSSLPLHLLYRFDQAGKYSVRLTVKKENQILYRSEWTDIAVEPFSEGIRQAWLDSVDSDTRTNNRAVVSDAIPSLLAWPDEKALAALLKIIPGSAPGCTNFDCIKLGFGTAALAWFDGALLREKVQPARLLGLCPPEGRCK